jgi:hypothetical protein
VQHIKSGAKGFGNLKPYSIFADMGVIHDEATASVIRRHCRERNHCAVIEYSERMKCLVFHTLLCPGGVVYERKIANDFRGKCETKYQVYFIQAVPDGLIKIGKANCVHTRLKELRCASPNELKLLATIEDDDPKAEAKLHKRFAPHRIRGEWFHPAPELLDFIKGLQS